MASRQIVTFVSDISGIEIDLGADSAPTVRFGLDDVDYEIDLTPSEAADLRATLGPYVAAARRTSVRQSTGVARGTPTVVPKPSMASPQLVRAWARENGFEVPTRGRIPAAVMEAFNLVN